MPTGPAGAGPVRYVAANCTEAWAVLEGPDSAALKPLAGVLPALGRVVDVDDEDGLGLMP
jgi:hypothetical protein